MQFKNKYRGLRSSLLVMVLLVTWSLGRSALAQNAQGNIVGHVTDPTGAAIPNATVTVTNTDTNVPLTFHTNSVGDYTAPAINPGPYTVTVNAPGFRQAVSQTLTLEVQQTLRENVKLQVGTAASKVVVSASNQMLHTDDTTTGQVLSANMIQALPIYGGDFTNLMLTNAGTNITPGGSGVDWGYHGLNTQYMETSSNGVQAQSTNYTVDGIFDADFFFSVPINIPNDLAINQFKMMSGMYGAQYGEGVTSVNVDIKSGTSSLHGAAYERLESQTFQPNSPLQELENRITGSHTPVNPPFHQDQFGGTLGGPLWIPHVYSGKKTFWFVSYDEGLFSQINTPSTDYVPTAAEISGNFSDWPFPIYDPTTTKPNPNYNKNLPVSPTNSPIIRTPFPNNQIPASMLDPVSQRLAKFFDSENITNCSVALHLTTGCFNYSADTKTTRTQGVGTGRIDQYIGSLDHIYLTANVGSLKQESSSIRFGQGGEVFTLPKLFGATWNHSFSPNLMNQATLGYDRDHYDNSQNTAYGPDISAQVGLANTNPNPVTYDSPQVNIFDYQGFGGGEPTTYTDDIYQGIDTVTYVHGRHTLNFGINYMRLQLAEFDNYLGTGALNFNGEFTAEDPAAAGSSLGNSSGYSAVAPYEGNAMADFLLGDTSSASGPPPVATDDYVLWGNNWNLYAQDDIQATDHLTINAGLRWERPPSLHSKNSDGYAFLTGNGGQFQWANCNFTKPILAVGGNPNFLQCGAANTLVPIDQKDFAPRIGFSYNPAALNQRLVIRGGYGIFYGLYNRYYDGTQFDKDSLYNESAPTISTPTGLETQSTGVVQDLWSAPVNADQLFVTPGWEFPFNQVNWPHNHDPYDEQWSLDTQYQLRPSLMLDVGYVGDHGLRQPSQDIIGSATPPRVAGDPCNSLADISQATGSSASCLTDPNFQPMDTREPYANMPPYLYANYNAFHSSYNALQVQLIQRQSHGLMYHINYTWSKTMDLTSGINLINGEPSLIQDPQNPYQMYGLAASNQTNRLVVTYAYQVPDFHFTHFNRLLTGWTASGIDQLSSGFPFAIGAGESQDQFSEFYAGRILANSTYQNSPGFRSTLTRDFDTSKYSTPALGRYGNTNKSPENTPFYADFNMSFGKTTTVYKGSTLMIRADIFNLGSTWHSSTGLLFPDSTVTDTTFGAFSNTTEYGATGLYNPRIIQMVAQYTF